MGIRGLRKRVEEVKGFFTPNLERHFQAEEEILFPMMRSFIPQSQSLIEALVDEHRKMRGAVLGLEEDTDLSKALFDFGDLLERHIRREERELFPLFEKHVTQEDAGRVKREIEEVLERERRRPSSRAET
jgi:hemerythrin-like domain-containing protein